jgi:hypothetical protein
LPLTQTVLAHQPSELQLAAQDAVFMSTWRCVVTHAPGGNRRFAQARSPAIAASDSDSAAIVTAFAMVRVAINLAGMALPPVRNSKLRDFQNARH